MPRIDHIDRAALEVADVARGEPGAAVPRNGRDLRVELGDRTTLCAARRDHVRIDVRRCAVEGEDTAWKS